MIPVVIWGGTQTGANSLKYHLRLENEETDEYRDSFKDEIIPLLNDKHTADNIKNGYHYGQWAFKYILQNMDSKHYIKVLDKKIIIRIPHGKFLDEDNLNEFIKISNELNYKHIFLYRESLFDQVLGWIHEEFGSEYENKLPVNMFNDMINTFKSDLYYTYNFIKEKVDLNLLSYESFYIRREKDKVMNMLNSLGFNITLEKMHTFIFGRYKHLKDGDKFKIDEKHGPISETIQHSHKNNFDLLHDIFCDTRIKL